MNNNKIWALLLVVIMTASASVQAVPALGESLEWQSFQPSFLDTVVSRKSIGKMAAFKDHIYAGGSPNPEIWRSSDGENWTYVTHLDFDGTNSSSLRFLTVFGDHLYAGIGSSGSEGFIYRTSDGLNWYQCGSVPSHPFQAVVFDGYLYLNVNWSLLYRSRNGTDWEYASAFNALDRICVFGEYLYAVFINTDDQVEIWRSRDGVSWDLASDNAFGPTTTTYIFSMTAFDSYLYIGSTNYEDCIEVWRSQNGSDWIRVVTSGFGDQHNAWALAMAVLGSQLYLGTNQHGRPSWTGTEIWRTSDGLSWEQVNEDGFGNPDCYKVESNCMAVFKNRLYLGTGSEGSIPDTIAMGGAHIRRTVNRVPAVEGASAETNAETAVDIPLTASDDDGDALTYQTADKPANGTVTIDGTTATYTPNSGFYGIDRFTWKASDGKMISAAAEVGIRVLYNDDGGGDESTGGGGGGGGCFLEILGP